MSGHALPGTSAAGTRHPRVEPHDVVIWLVWAVMTLVALITLHRYGRNVPLAEDWQLVAPFAGREPHWMQWLWSQNNEHRVPVPRLIMLGLLWVSNGDFRSGMLFDVLSLSLLSAAMMRTARVVRGRSSVSDAFFPLLLLHIGHWENLFWTWQLSFVISVELAAVILLVFVRRPALDSPTAFWTVATALVLLPLCGATGLIFVPAFGAWMMYCLWNGRVRVGQRGVWVRAGATALAGVVAVAYFVGYESPTWNPPNPGLGVSLRTSLQFLALGWGPAVIGYWWSAVSATIALLGVTGALLLRALWRERRTGISDIGALTVFMLNAALFTLLIGYGRAGQILLDGRWPLRYVLLSALTLCGAYFCWLRLERRHTRQVVPLSLALAMVLLVMPNDRAGWRLFGAWYDAGMTALEIDLAANTPVITIAERHRAFLVHWLTPAALAAQIETLQAERISSFSRQAPPSRTGRGFQ